MPPVVKNLLIINGLVFLATFGLGTGGVFGDVLFRYFALWPPPLFAPWQVVTYAFLHDSAGISHILFNMFGLWMFGSAVEPQFGTKRFVIYYFACVVGAALLHLAVGALTGGIYPTVGASGGVLGVLLAFGMMYPDAPIYLFPLPVPVKAKWVVVGYAVLDLFGGFAGTGSNVAHFAHLGGMLTGFLLIQYWRGRPPFAFRRRAAA